MRPPDPDVSDLDRVCIRPARQADLLSVFRIEKACFPQPWPFSSFEQFLGDPGFLVAASDADDVLGYVVSDVTPNYGRDIGHVKDLAVHPGVRGRGVGRRLLDRALRTLSAEGAMLVKLEVREGNDAARSLYRDVGFRKLRRVRGYYDDGEDAVMMVLDVPEWRRSGTDVGGAGSDADAEPGRDAGTDRDVDAGGGSPEREG